MIVLTYVPVISVFQPKRSTFKGQVHPIQKPIYSTAHASATHFVKCTFVERHQQRLTLVLHQQLQHRLLDWKMNQQSSDCHFTNLTASKQSFSSHSLKPSRPPRHSINPRYSSLTLPDDRLSVKWMLTEPYKTCSSVQHSTALPYILAYSLMVQHSLSPFKVNQSRPQAAPPPRPSCLRGVTKYPAGFLG